VMCTHLHWDHVGWNTQLCDGRWVPTFPKARYIFAQAEWKAWETLHRKDAQPHLVDSIVPVIEAHQAQFVSNDFALDDEVWLEPTPGHTPGHVSIHLASQGAQAVITGDCIHSPVQCVEPGWIIRADFDPMLARTTRRSFLERYCDSNVMVCATHFPEPSMGRIIQRDKAFWFEYEGIPD
jgi:glyoxylase-like metal-dependent hydrolase (beta-lactamase superfamily II)